ncbi:hypothetical protein FRC11_013739 [Ceratobasidium sp. 423]|nr:hypothetical protein FRC11_013739 [Ceratobasidium sp. 423]
MSVPPGFYRLRYIPNWQQPPPGVGGMYATYNKGPFITAEAGGSGAQGSQVWEVTKGHEDIDDTIVIRTRLLGSDAQYWHNPGIKNNEPLIIGPEKSFKVIRSHNQDIPDLIICKIAPIDAPERFGVTYCVGTDNEDGVDKVVTKVFEEVSGIPGWQFIPAE